MMQMLIVDDEVHCAEGVKSQADWKSLGITGVFTAYSMKQAQAVMEEKSIDIVISDVEMPKGSGFELLKWLRDCKYQPVTIMLTSYANFDYARQAIEFQCLDYLLKPVSKEALVKTVREAADKVMERRKNDECTRLAEYWNENERYLIRQFWREVLERQEWTDSETIAAKARQRHITFDERNKYMPVVFKMHGHGNQCWTEDLKSCLYEDVFDGKSQTVLMYNNRYMLAIVGYASDFKVHFNRIFDNIKAFIRQQDEEYFVGISSYMGDFEDAAKVIVQYERLCKMAADNVAEQIGVYKIDAIKRSLQYERPDIEQWFKDFGKQSLDKIIDDVDHYVDYIVSQHNINKETLTRLLHDFMQVFYVAVNEKGIQAHLLFEDDLSGNMYVEAAYSAENFKKLVHYLLTKAADYIRMVSDSDTVIARIKNYIKENLTKELNREVLAETFYMSPDYLSRMFRQKTGIKLMDYVTQVRIKQAKYLLSTTDMPVGEVAYESGYYNVAYFSKVFRIHNGETPAQYRSRMRI